jgi:hypothetical protein
MAFFNSFTDSLKQKWLQFFQVNRDWITLQMEVESVYTPDGGKRPPSYLILGVANALEPKLAQLMFPFAKLNPDADTLIEVLDLNFDPDIALGNRVIPKVDESYQYESPVVVEDTTETAALTDSDLSDGFGEETVTEDFPIGNDVAAPILTVSESEETDNGFGEISASNGHNLTDEFDQTSVSGVAEDAFGDISFESESLIDASLDESALEELTPPDENAFSDVLSDVWGDETSLHKGEENNDFLGEDLPTGVFDDSEIARLFPNS